MCAISNTTSIASDPPGFSLVTVKPPAGAVLPKYAPYDVGYRPVKVVVTPVITREVFPLEPEYCEATSVTVEPLTWALVRGAPSARTRFTVTDPALPTAKLAPE